MESANASLAAGYEIRWWARNGDDIAADVFVFPGSRQAQDFLGLATDAHCRQAGTVTEAHGPPGVRNLSWVNPDRVSENDAYLQRGKRVYRIVDVRPQRSGKPPSSRQQRIAFLLVDILACLLPEAECRARPYQVVPDSRPQVVTASLEPPPSLTPRWPKPEA